MKTDHNLSKLCQPPNFFNTYSVFSLTPNIQLHPKLCILRRLQPKNSKTMFNLEWSTLEELRCSTWLVACSMLANWSSSKHYSNDPRCRVRSQVNRKELGISCRNIQWYSWMHWAQICKTLQLRFKVEHNATNTPF
jgi:hypothetical protein